MKEHEEKMTRFLVGIADCILQPSPDPEETLFICLKNTIDTFGCIEASVFIADRERKNAYAVANGKAYDQRNIPFSLKAKPELALYYEPALKTVLKPVAGFEKGVYRFEELSKILVPIDPKGLSLLFCECDRVEPEGVKCLHKIMGLLSLLVRPLVEETEIYKLLYGTNKNALDEDLKDRDVTLSRLAGSVAHLLNQPLTSLMGNIELLIRKGGMGKDKLSSLKKIYGDAERLADVVKKIESVNSYATEDYIGSTKILKLEDYPQRDRKEKASKTSEEEKKVSNKLEIFLDFYRGVSQSKSKNEITHNYAFSINRMFPNLKLLLLSYNKRTDEFSLEYKEKGGYSRDFELSEEKTAFYKKIMNDLNLKIYRFDDSLPHIVTIPLVIDYEKMGIAEFDFESEEISMFDLILLESMVDELVLALHRLKLAEKNRYLKDYVSNLIENTSSMIFVIDEKLAIRTCNPSFEEVMNLAKLDIEGKMFDNFIHDGTQREALRNAVRECFRGKVIRKLDLPLSNRSGHKIDTRFSLIPLPKVKNLRPEIIAIGQNITEVKQLENQIMQTEKLAYMGQMAASVAHELNNPLTSITVFSEYLLKRIKNDLPESEEVYADKLTKIYENANRIHSFAKNLTSLSRPSDGYSPEEIDINGIVKESLLFSDYEIKKNNVSVECELSENLPKVSGVKNQLHQVFINLLSNASHAFDSNGGKIKVSSSAPEGEHVRIDIIDNGKGITQEIIDKIFDPFVSTRKEQGGTGLGLSIVKRIIGDHKGRIEVKSEEGKGTTFSVYLPKLK